MVYRLKQTKDRELISSLQKKHFPGCPAHLPEDSFWWVIEHGFNTAAFAGYSLCGKEAYLCRAAVEENHKGNGLHTRLIRARLRHAKRSGATRAVTDTRLNPASSNNLIDCGFRMFTPDDPWSFKEACYWYKDL